MKDCCADKGSELELLAEKADQRRVLVIVLVLNALMFVAEFTAGLIAGSAALMADSVDMLGDATVYGLSLYAMGRSIRWKAGAAVAKGLFILALFAGIVVQIVTRVETGVPPSSTLMLVFGGIALAVNLYCLRLLWRFRALDVNMSSTVECSRNDALANAGVLSPHWRSRFPDHSGRISSSPARSPPCSCGPPFACWRRRSRSCGMPIARQAHS